MMNVLFVCRGNVGRSQMAAAFYNRLTNSQDASSAGTHVEKPGQTLLERKSAYPGRSFVVDVMHEVGIDVEDSRSAQLTPDMLHNYDLIINMAGKHFTPSWLATAPNYVYWKIRDPMAKSYAVTARTRDAVRRRVEDLIQQTP